MALNTYQMSADGGWRTRTPSTKSAATKSTSSSGSSNATRKSTTAVAVPNTSNIMDQLKSLYAQQQNAAAAYQSQLQGAAQGAYDRNMSALQEAYQNKIGALASGYDSVKAQLGNQYNYSKQNVNNDAERALREAYVNKMLSGKNLQQQLTAQGLSGGASETTLASLQNNYGNSRNNIETTRNDNLRDLLNTYQNNLAAAAQEYNNQLAAAEDSRMSWQMQIENALANAITGSFESQINAMSGVDSNYFNTLAGLLSDQAQYAFKNAQATNTPLNVTSLAQNDMGTYTDYAKYLASSGLSRAQELRQAGQSDDAIAGQLYQAGIDQQTIMDILNQLNR